MTSTADGASPRARRADARRNREHILDVAHRYFAEHGVGGSLDAIARRAGVGAGTLYRHFPTREALLAELLTPRDRMLVARRDALENQPGTAADALAGWLDALVEWASAFGGLTDHLRAATTAETSALSVTCEGYVSMTDTFLRAAQREGRARADVRALDLFLAALATSWVRDAAMADASSATALTALTRKGWEEPTRDSGSARASGHQQHHTTTIDRRTS